MAESINLKKRLVGKEDIDFDITGTNETYSFFTSDGGQKKLSKINASHFPLTREAREKLNAVNVDEALQVLSDKVENFETSDALSENVTVNFMPEDDAETIQNKINQQKKNLNGFTLTFVFPASLAQNLYSSLVLEGFFYGTVVISGEAKNSRIAIYDRQNITSLFKVYRCLCEVRIEYFYFVHQYSEYAVSVESSPAVIIRDCNFSGMENTDSYAVNKMVGNAVLIDCELSDDMEFYPPQEAEGNTGVGKSIGEVFAYPAATPPEGAYLLNGQTIYGCDELYPAFWEWVTTAGVRIVDNDTYNAELAETGVCGGFVIRNSAGSVRLPTVINGTLWGADSSNVGQSLAAGLPNITGSFGVGRVDNGSATGVVSFEDYGQTNVSGGGGWPNIRTGTISIDASRSNSAFGKSDTVQPPAIRVSWCIQVFNAATAMSEQESVHLASQMQMKAQTDLGNVTNPTQAFKEMSVGWGMPDYTAGVSKAKDTLYTAECDGYLIYVGDVTGSYTFNIMLKINGIEMQHFHCGAADNAFSFCVPINKGDSYITTSNGPTKNYVFYPLKGVKNG